MNCWFCYRESGDDYYHEKCSMQFFGVRKVPELLLNDDILKELASRTVNNSIAVSGVQPKLSVSIEKTRAANRLTIVGLWGEYILKPQQHQYLAMPETEDLTMHLASLFDLKVCEHALIKASDGSMVYLAKRFDRKSGIKIHCEDFCQLSELPTANKYKSSYERAGKLIRKYCKHSGFDALEYLELVLFCFLTGNNDMHLKNFSLLHEAAGIALSPAYDLLNVNLVFPADKEELALTLNGKKKKLKLSDFEALAKTLMIPAKTFENTCKKFTSRGESVNSLIEASFLPANARDQYKDIWAQKLRIFSN